jgi:hypothetical protein
MPNYTDLDNSSLYTSGQGTQMFVSPTPFDESESVGGDIPGAETLTLAAAVTLAATSITLDTGCTKILYEGQPLVFTDGGTKKVVRVSTKTAAAATTVPILPAEVAIAAASEAIVECFVPFFSLKSVNTSRQSQEFQDQACNTLVIAKAVSGILASGQSSGPDIYGDPGKEAIESALDSGKMLRVMVCNAQGRGGRIFNARFSADEQRSNNAFNQYPVTYHINGEAAAIPVNA